MRGPVAIFRPPCANGNASDKGDADAQFKSGAAYKLGRGVPQDLTRAEMLYAKAASQGHLQAGDNYGLLLFQRGSMPPPCPISAPHRTGAIRVRNICWVWPISTPTW
jgi:TPR repeat protein